MLPSTWGKYGWNFCHLVTLAYPEKPTTEDMLNYRNFFDSLKHVLPCEKCRKNMNQHLQKYPLTDEVLSGKKKLIKWLIDLHNVVNYYTGKPMLSYTEAVNELNKLTNPPTNKTDYFFNGMFVIAVLVVVFLIYYCWARKKN
jgi:hypothetical protein